MRLLGILAEFPLAFAWVLFLLGVLLVCFLLVIGNRIVADWFMLTLEGQFVDSDPFAEAVFDEVILLGGGTGETHYGGLQVNENGDRVVTAARLFHRGIVRKIYCSGVRTGSLSRFASDESDQSQRLLEEIGVPASAIETIGGRNTSEEMIAIAEAIDGRPVGIISSAWHLPRVMRLADAANINAVPVPCGFMSNLPRRRPITKILRDFIPNHRAMKMNTYAMKEYVARLLGR